MDKNMKIPWKSFCAMLTATGRVVSCSSLFMVEVSESGDTITVTDPSDDSEHLSDIFPDCSVNSFEIPRDLNLGSESYDVPWAGVVEADSDGVFTVECAYGTFTFSVVTVANPLAWWGPTGRSVCGIVDQISDAHGLDWGTDDNIQALASVVEACVAPETLRRVVWDIATEALGDRCVGDQDEGEEDTDG